MVACHLWSKRHVRHGQFGQINSVVWLTSIWKHQCKKQFKSQYVQLLKQNTVRRTIWCEVSDNVSLPAVRCGQRHIRNVACDSMRRHWLQPDQIPTAEPKVIHHKMMTLQCSHKSTSHLPQTLETNSVWYINTEL